MVGWAGDATRFDRELRGEGPACALGSAYYCDPAREGARPDACYMGGPLPNAQDLNERQAKPPPRVPGFRGDARGPGLAAARGRGGRGPRRDVFVGDRRAATAAAGRRPAPVPKRREMSDFGMIERFEKTYPQEKPALTAGPDWARNDRGGWTWKGRADRGAVVTSRSPALLGARAWGFYATPTGRAWNALGRVAVAVLHEAGELRSEHVPAGVRVGGGERRFRGGGVVGLDAETEESDAQLVRRDLAIAVRVDEAELAFQRVVAPALFDGVLHLPSHGQVRLVEGVPVVEAVADDRRRETARREREQSERRAREDLQIERVNRHRREWNFSADRKAVSLPSASGLMWPRAKSRIAQPAPGSAPRFSARRDVTTPRNTVSSVNATSVATTKLTTPATMGCGRGPNSRSTKHVRREVELGEERVRALLDEAAHRDDGRPTSGTDHESTGSKLRRREQLATVAICEPDGVADHDLINNDRSDHSFVDDRPGRLGRGLERLEASSRQRRRSLSENSLSRYSSTSRSRALPGVSAAVRSALPPAARTPAVA